MNYHHGRFVWFELLTPDTAVAAAFYGGLFDWQIAGVAGADGSQRSIRHRGSEIGGMIPPPASGLGPEWVGYFSVPHVGRAARRAEKAGARPHSAPVKIPSVGEVAPMRDPGGANFCLFSGARRDPPRTQGPGAWYWVDLLAKEPGRAAAFYVEGLGMEPARQTRFGGEPEMLCAQGAAVAGVISPPAEIPPGWLPYVRVESLSAVLSRGEALGATFPLGALEGGAGRFAVMRDPFGAHLAVIEPL